LYADEGDDGRRQYSISMDVVGAANQTTESATVEQNADEVFDISNNVDFNQQPACDGTGATNVICHPQDMRVILYEYIVIIIIIIIIIITRVA